MGIISQVVVVAFDEAAWFLRSGSYVCTHFGRAGKSDDILYALVYHSGGNSVCDVTRPIRRSVLLAGSGLGLAGAAKAITRELSDYVAILKYSKSDMDDDYDAIIVGAPEFQCVEEVTGGPDVFECRVLVHLWENLDSPRSRTLPGTSRRPR